MPTEFFARLTEEERSYTWFQQDSATVHTAHNSLASLEGVFGDREISRGLWPVRSHYFTSRDSYLWGKLKNKVYRTNPQH
jgi:hypothetical protein